MVKFFKYFKAQCKRACKVYPVVLAFTLILSACLLLLLGQMMLAEKNSEGKSRMKVGVVGDLNDTSLGLIVEAIQDTDSSKSYLEFVTTTEEEALKALKSGEFYGYIKIPEDFVKSISEGTNKHLTYVSSDSPSTVGPLLVNEIVGIISDFLKESQNGVYGLSDIAEMYEVPKDEYDENEEAINLKYFDMIFSRSEIYDANIVYMDGGLTFGNYYIFAFIVLLLLLWGIAGAIFLIRQDMALPRLLKSNGHGSFGQVVGEYLPFFAMMFLNLAILVTVIGFIPVKGIDPYVTEAVKTPVSALVTALKLLPCAALISAMQFFLYELTSNTISAVLTQLLAALSLSYVSGLLYPINSLPAVLQKLASFLPTGMSFDYAVGVVFGKYSFATVAGIIGYIVFFLIMAALVRSYKMRSNRL